MTAQRWKPSDMASDAAVDALWPWVLTNTMVARRFGSGVCVRALHAVCLCRSTLASSSTGMLIMPRRLEISSSPASSTSLAGRTSTSTARIDLDCTSSQNAVGLSRANARRLLRMDGRLPPVVGFFCDF
jgi:hypothetical protein